MVAEKKDLDAAERVIAERRKFAEEYFELKGWDFSEPTLDQIKELSAHPRWKEIATEIAEEMGASEECADRFLDEEMTAPICTAIVGVVTACMVNRVPERYAMIACLATAKAIADRQEVDVIDYARHVNYMMTIPGDPFHEAFKEGIHTASSVVDGLGVAVAQAEKAGKTVH